MCHGYHVQLPLFAFWIIGMGNFVCCAINCNITIDPNPNQATNGKAIATSFVTKLYGSLYFNMDAIDKQLVIVNPTTTRCMSTLTHLDWSCNYTKIGDTFKVVTKFFNVQSNFTVLLWSFGTSGWKNITFNVTDCPHNTSNVGPKISAVDYTYNAPGQFECPTGQELFYSNSTPGITNTFCQNGATWYGSSGLECWADPQPTITGNFSGVEGTTITVNCNPLNKVYPPVTSFNFVIGGTPTKKQTSSSHTFMLSRHMNAQQVYCQANTKYTQLNSTLGKSSFQTLNVTFKPYKGKTAGCTENQQCDIEVVSNPAPGNPVLVAPAMESFTWTVLNHPYYTFQITKPKGTYMFRVNNSVGEGMFNVTIDAKTPISPSNLPLIIGASVAGVLVIAFVIILIVVIRRRNAGKSEQEERQNPIYGSSPNAVDNGTDYAQVQKKNKKNKKEMTENIAYQPASSPDAIEDAYASVSKNEKEVKMNILYGSSTGAHTSQVEDAYAEVDKGKKKKKDKTKAMKVNVAYVPTPENPDAPEEAYAEVNKDKKKKGKKGEKEMKDNILYGSSQAGGSVEDAYAEVDKKKKKNAGAKQGEGSSGATYSEVSKPKNKKKDKSSSSQTPDDDPYAEVDLHGQDSSNLE